MCIDPQWAMVIFSALLVAVTIWYVIETRNIARQSAPTGWLEPQSIGERFGPKVTLKIKNIGPGHAINIKVFLTLKKEIPRGNEKGKILTQITELQMKGQTRILEGEEQEYVCEPDDGKHVFVMDNMKLRIEWLSVSGKKLSHIWYWEKDINKRNNWYIKK